MVHAATKRPSLFEALFRGPAKPRRVKRPADTAPQAESKAKGKLGRQAKGRASSASKISLG